MSNTVKVPPALADQAIDHEGRKFLLIQAAVLVEVEASENATSPHIVDGMVAFNDSSDPRANHSDPAKPLGMRLPNGRTVMLLPWLPEGATLEEQIESSSECIRKEYDRLTRSK